MDENKNKQDTATFASLETLIARVPLFHLRCTISENAVRCLEKEIYPG